MKRLAIISSLSVIVVIRCGLAFYNGWDRSVGDGPSGMSCIGSDHFSRGNSSSKAKRDGKIPSTADVFEAAQVRLECLKENSSVKDPKQMMVHFSLRLLDVSASRGCVLGLGTSLQHINRGLLHLSSFFLSLGEVSKIK